MPASSLQNNSTNPILDTESFTGVGEDVHQHKASAVMVSVYTDQNTDMYLEWSPDNTNWDISTQYEVLAMWAIYQAR